MTINKIWQNVKRLLLENTAKNSNDDEIESIYRDLRGAHAEWICAQKKLQSVSNFEEIDYSIYLLETAEKRYNMFLKQAKSMHSSWKVDNHK